MLDLAARTLCRDGHELRITTGEFAVLAALVQRPRQALTRDQLMSAARGREHDAFDRSMDVMISRLRKRVEDDPRHPRWLQTVWGTGYVFVPGGAESGDIESVGSGPGNRGHGDRGQGDSRDGGS